MKSNIKYQWHQSITSLINSQQHQWHQDRCHQHQSYQRPTKTSISMPSMMNDINEHQTSIMPQHQWDQSEQWDQSHQSNQRDQSSTRTLAYVPNVCKDRHDVNNYTHHNDINVRSTITRMQSRTSVHIVCNRCDKRSITHTYHSTLSCQSSPMPTLHTSNISIIMHHQASSTTLIHTSWHTCVQTTH